MNDPVPMLSLSALLELYVPFELELDGLATLAICCTVVGARGLRRRQPEDQRLDALGWWAEAVRPWARVAAVLLALLAWGNFAHAMAAGVMRAMRGATPHGAGRTEPGPADPDLPPTSEANAQAPETRGHGESFRPTAARPIGDPPSRSRGGTPPRADTRRLPSPDRVPVALSERHRALQVEMSRSQRGPRFEVGRRSRRSTP